MSTRARRCGFHAANFLLTLDRTGDRGIDVSRRSHRHLGRDLTGAGIHHVGGALGSSSRVLAVDEMRNLFGHGAVSGVGDKY
jgi:hypothetical protein